MAMKQMKAWIAILALASVLTTGAAAQDVPLGDLKLFAPAQLDPLSGNPKPKEGYFATLELLHWSLQPPDKSTIGKEGIDPLVHDVGLVRRQGNSLNTSEYGAGFVDGNRFEAGRVQGHWGWLFSTFKLKGHDQSIFGSDVDVNFQDTKVSVQFAQIDPNTGNVVGIFNVDVGYLDGFPDQNGDGIVDDQDGDGIHGPFWDADMDGNIDDILDPGQYDLDDLVRMATIFSELAAKYSTDMWGMELMPFHRAEQFHNGGNLELGIGVRYLRIDDAFSVLAEGLRVDPGTTTSFWHTDSENHVVGPQALARYFRTKGRLTLSAQGRFFAGWNFQNVIQKGSLSESMLRGPRAVAVNTFLTFPNDEFNHNLNETEFSPGVEVQLRSSYQLTRAIAVAGGWNGMWIGGIARSPNLVDYTLPKMGLLADHNRQDLFVHGLTFGIEVNR